MNWKLFGAMAALIGVGASVALGQGTSTTIVEANYISNVFGQSNFVKNPNAKLNNANVTVSSATVTRSATTPLVATSEFNITTSTATGYADWSLRTFDAGIKNQNCEARFTYRGFSVGSTTAQILQGANVVAQLTLTPSATDPRIASINFPCGDLSAATTFRLQQATAALTGTNEIGGIYAGLATNQANVAQAEYVGSLTWPTTGSAENVFISSTSFTNFGTFSAAPVADGQVSSPSNAPAITITNFKPGNYVFVLNDGLQCYAAATTSCLGSVRFSDEGSLNTEATTIRNDYATGILIAVPTVQFALQYNGPTTSKTFKLQGRVTSTNMNVRMERMSNGDQIKISVYRFPTSSELVVTPERQNVFAGVVHTSGTQSLHSGSAEPTTFSSYNSATWNQPTRLKGKAAVTTTNSGNDLGFSVPNLPVGNYEMKISGAINTLTGGSGVYSICNFRVRETTTDSTVIAYQHNGESTPGTGTRDYVTSGVGVFTNNSVATRNFILEASKFADTTTTNNSSCEVFTSSSPTGASYNTYVTITLTPLDQPSNSALYVQGPVQAAATGAAIPSGYQMEGITVVNSSISGVSNGTNRTGTGITLSAGVYLVTMKSITALVAPTVLQCGITKTVNTASIADDLNFPTIRNTVEQGNTTQAKDCTSSGYFKVTSSTTFYPTVQIGSPTSSGYQNEYWISAIRLN